ncbi:peptidoglycan-binding protein [Trinickia symbiotica]|uniref:Peptidoglycan-binding protein n=1 Tax=Trinickia symbiotica TaxID=863227 RepID=A0A2T3XSN4_9BURK|nr:N-acetylmuramidase domain-containing protein [Trinickia symbiotica]PTB19540.1 peptidoglycan-binding protein [Trinickia symbiotica]
MPTPLALIAFVAHFATLVRVLTYRRNGARYRHHASWVAWALVAVMGGSAIELALHIGQVNIFEAAAAVMLAVFVIRARGNVARLLRSELTMKTHRLGDGGNDVALLQRRLTRAGFPLEVTHLYDDATETAVAAFQRKIGLVDDGIAGPKTYAALSTGQRDLKQLSVADLERAAQTLDVPIACVRAVNEVESSGMGFLHDGRPIILFERHIFWKRLKARGVDPAPLAAKNRNILSQTPGGYQSGAAEYTRLAAAELIDVAAAWESASWGAFQVMGYRWERLGYASVDDFVARMEASEADQLDAFVRYVKADAALTAALRARKWAAFAKGYNGPKYAAKLYDVKLERAYARYAARDAVAAEDGMAVLA